MQLSFAILGFLFLIFLKVKAENYGCPAGWKLGEACGNNNCYRVVSIPPANKPRAIDDNFCGKFDKDSMPASIRCKEENELIATMFPILSEITGLGIGFYIPANLPWGRNNFRNRDGSKTEFTSWGFISFIVNGPTEPGPGGGGEKATLYFSRKRGQNYVQTWHDVGPTALRHLLCKRPALIQPPKPITDVVKKDDRNGSYECPAGFDLGNVCGGHFCYRVVSVPPARRSRMIDDNYCSEIDKSAMPAIIRCKEENDFIEGNKYVYTWHDVGDTVSPNLLCKTTAKLNPTLPARKADEFSSYSCPKDWVLGDVCGEHHCYKIVTIPANKRARVIDDNYCGEIDKRSIPAIIRCEEENEFLSTPPFAPSAIQSGFGLGLYIPANKPWTSNGFINYDGSKIEYLKWGIDSFAPIKEPNGWANGFSEKVAVYLMEKDGNDYRKAWHDIPAKSITKVLCKMPATGVGAKTKPPPQDPPMEEPIMQTLLPEPLPTKRPSRQSCFT